jgi:hypothetical protein
MTPPRQLDGNRWEPELICQRNAVDSLICGHSGTTRRYGAAI